MSSISSHELNVIKKCISKVAKGRGVVATCDTAQGLVATTGLTAI
jgi:hypothetical protein